MNRSLKLSIMLALAAGGGHAWAQNLGPVQMRSTMEQPLMAEIPLTGVTGSLDRLHVALASEEAFSRAGLNRAGLPVSLEFTVARNGSGQPVIRVTSGSPVRDTYLDFLVEVSNGDNRVVREVTMLLDPPGTPIGAAATPAAPSAPAERPSRTSDVPSRVPAGNESRPSRSDAPATARSPAAPAAPARVAAQAPAAAARSHAATSSASTVGPIQRGQTLSTIAREHASGAQMSQMLVALQKANPDAFYRDNINALKTGAVLRIPSADDIQAQSAGSALAEVRRQNEAWRTGAARTPSVVADAASGSAPAAPAGKATAPANDRLALVPAKEGGEAASTRAGARGGKGDAQVAGLKQDLSTSQEAVASLKQQGDELKSRIGDLESINTKNQRLLSLKDSEIADLQRKLAETRKAASQAAVPSTAGGTPTAVAATTKPAAAATAPPTAMIATPASTATAASTPAASAATPATVAAVPAAVATSMTPAAAPVAAPAAAAPKPAAPRALPGAPVVDDAPWFMQPWAWGAGAVVVLLLLVGAVASRRRKREEPLVSTASLADRFDEEQGLGGTDQPFHHHIDTDLDRREILDALEEHPDDIGLHLELVSLYYGRRDVENFEGAAEAMHAHVADEDQPEWREVMKMGEDLAPSHPLFGGMPHDDVYVPGTPRDATEAAALEEFDLGTYVTGPEDDETDVVAPQKHSEYHFNFDLTPVQRAEAEERPNAPDVFDVDASASPYVEPVHHHEQTPVAGSDDEHSTWSFADELDGALTADTATHLPPPLPGEAEELHASFAPEEAVHTPSFLDDPHVPPTPQETALHFDEPTFPDDEPVADHVHDGFSDDPVDTKLDLARAYLDMGDPEGARLMLDEVLAEGTQMQKDTAKRILADIV